MSVVVFQVCHSTDMCLQACARQLWLVCARFDITAGDGYIPGESLLASAEVLSRWHLGQTYQERVQHLIDNNGIKLIEVPAPVFHLSPLV